MKNLSLRLHVNKFSTSEMQKFVDSTNLVSQVKGEQNINK